MRDMLRYMRANPVAMTLIALVLGTLLALFGTGTSSAAMFMIAGTFIMYLSERRTGPRH